VEKAKEAKT